MVSNKWHYQQRTSAGHLRNVTAHVRAAAPTIVQLRSKQRNERGTYVYSLDTAAPMRIVNYLLSGLVLGILICFATSVSA